MVPWAPVGSPAMSWQWVSVLVRFATTSASTVSLGDSLFLCHSPIPRIMVTTIMAAITKNTSIKTTSDPPPQKIIRISPFASCMASEYHTFVRFSMKTRKNPQFRQIFDFCRYCGFFLTGLFYFPVFSNGSDHINNIFWHIQWWNNMHWIQ